MPTLIDQVAVASAEVAATASRTAKVARLVELLGQLEATEIEPVVAWLTGELRQGRVGTGWATVYGLDADPAPVASFTVRDLDDAIGRLQALSGPGSSISRQRLLSEVLSALTATEGDFVRRLLVGELRQGVLRGVMTEALAAASGLPAGPVRRAAMLAGDLPRVARLALTEGLSGLSTITLQPLHPVEPMLASSATSVGEAVLTLGSVSVEWKLDGARVQAHRRADEVRLFTRNLNDITDRLPGVVDVVAALPVNDVVLDGEVVGMGDNDRPDLFADTMSRFTRHGARADGLRIWFFDCLFLDGVELIDRPLVDRLAALERAAGPWRVPSILTDDPVQAETFFDAVIADGHEGAMVKAAGSTYEAGRRGRSWLKVKPVLTLDLVVLAAEWGHGRRRGWLSNLHLGARRADGGWVMVGKTFKGLTDQLLAWQTEALLARQIATAGITVEVRPELVVEVGLDGVQVSRRYPGGVALRFARVRRYRGDKSAAEADTIDAVRDLLKVDNGNQAGLE